jgi:hypothetical protein
MEKQLESLVSPPGALAEDFAPLAQHAPTVSPPNRSRSDVRFIR